VAQSLMSKVTLSVLCPGDMDVLDQTTQVSMPKPLTTLTSSMEPLTCKFSINILAVYTIITMLCPLYNDNKMKGYT
jgi:hypothetical protein